MNVFSLREQLVKEYSISSVQVQPSHKLSSQSEPPLPIDHSPLTAHQSLPPFRWDEERRAQLRAELDAYYARLYGLTRDELRYILAPREVYGEDFPGETFRVLKEKEIKQFGEYRTRWLVLEAWDRASGG
jgi:hypothetical protein